MTSRSWLSQPRGQASLETMLLFAAILIMILAIAAVLPATASEGENLRQMLIARQSVQDVASAADEVFLSGEGASKTIWVELPSGFENTSSFIGNRTSSTAWKDRKLADINMLSVGDIFAVSRAPMCGNWPTVSGRYLVNVTYNATTLPHVSVNAKC